LSYVWWILEPIFTMLALYIVFSTFLDRGTPNYAAFLLIGITSWQWFNSCINRSLNSIIQNQILINQIYIPKVFFPIEATLWASFKSLIVFIVLLLFLIPYPTPVALTWIALPAIIFIQFVLIIAVSILCAAIVPFLQDLNMIISTAMRLLFFASGVFYEIDQILKPQHQFLMYLNPMAGLIKNYRMILIESQWPQWHYLFLVMFSSSVLLLAGVMLTKKFDHIYPSVC
jgi:lipopolysaccharide transport system permease protein